MRQDPITQFLDKFAWLAWFVLISSLMFGVGTDIGAIPGSAALPIGLGHLLFDIAMTTLCWCAALAMLATQLACGKVGNVWERISRWLMLGAQSVFCVRFTTMLLVNGDIYAPTITLIAFSLLSIAQILHCFGIFVRSVRYSSESFSKSGHGVLGP